MYFRLTGAGSSRTSSTGQDQLPSLLANTTIKLGASQAPHAANLPVTPVIQDKTLHFLIVGAQKAGSSWLADCLRRHPDVYILPREVHYFDVDAHFNRGAEWYATFFQNAEPNQLLGEKTPSLTIERSIGCRNHIPERLFNHNPDLRLLIVLRDPVKRALSALSHHLWNRRLPPTASVRELLFGRYSDEAHKWAILDEGLYYKQLSHFWDVFDRKQVGIWVFESDVLRRPKETLEEVADFIGVTPPVPVPAWRKIRNRSVTSRPSLIANYHAPMLNIAWQVLDRASPRSWRLSLPDDVRRDLRAFYAEDTRLLAEALGRNLGEWESWSR